MTSQAKERWSGSLADPSGQAFGEILADDVQLEGSIVVRPVHGRHAVWTCLRTAASLYDSVEFTYDALAGDRVYLEWTATALGMRMDGATILVLDAGGQFARVAVYHRPLAAVLAFSEEMAKRRAAGPGAGHFYQIP